MIHLSQELTHLEVMRIVWNLKQELMYKSHMKLSRLVAEKNVADNEEIISTLILTHRIHKNNLSIEELKIIAWIKGKAYLLKTKIQRKLEVKQVEIKLGEDCWVKVLMLSKYCSVKVLQSYKSQSTALTKVKDQRTADWSSVARILRRF